MKIISLQNWKKNQRNISCKKSEIARFSPSLFIALDAQKSIYSTLKAERFVRENKKCLTKLFFQD